MFCTIKNKFLSVTVAAKGAELQSIRDASGTEYLWQGDPAYWSGRALNLFPYVARLSDGKYLLDGNQYEMGIHGFAPYSVFSLVKQEPERMVWELTDNTEVYQQYPRHFAFRIMYNLHANCLDVTFEVENKDDRVMYFGLGGHPGFNVPLVPGVSFDEYRLRFHEKCRPRRVGFTKNKLRSGNDVPFVLKDGNILPLRHALFDEDAIVLKEMARKITLETDKDAHSVTVTYPDMPYLGIWHCPHSDAPYVCIEPWCSLPSCDGEIATFEKQTDLLRVEPGECYKNHWSIQIS